MICLLFLLLIVLSGFIFDDGILVSMLVVTARRFGFRWVRPKNLASATVRFRAKISRIFGCA